MKKDLSWRLLVLGAIVCAITAVAIPYVTLKLGMSVDLTYFGMFIAAGLLAKHATNNKQLAIQLNIIQTMINICGGIGFMVVVLSAFHYIQNVFGRNVGFDPSWWQMSLWLSASAVLGVFMGIWPRRAILRDKALPWPTGAAVLSVAETLTDPDATESVRKRRNVLGMSTAVAGFGTFLKDGLGVITPMIGNGPMKMMFGLEFAAIGLGMLIPLSVGLSGLLGVWIVNAFGPTVAKLAAMSGALPANWDQCYTYMHDLAKFSGAEKDAAVAFLTANCGEAGVYLTTPSTHFKYLVQWMMWPATGMMITAALTSVTIPALAHLFRDKSKDVRAPKETSLADEEIPGWWAVTGTLVSAAIIVWMTCSWFDLPWTQVVLAITIQPILIIAGLRVLGITGQGPVSLMANATQFVFGLIWPAHIRGNLVAAFTAATPQASSEAVVPSFWVAQRLGGKFKTLIIAMLIMVPVGAILTPFVFDLLVKTYGIGLNEGQLTAPTGLKIASLAMVMEKGVAALPPGALTASIIAMIIGVLFEILLAFQKDDGKGGKKTRFWWIPIPSALGFALILPPVLMIGMAVGSVISAVWNKFSPDLKDGSWALFSKPLAAGFVAGEAMIGAILLPLLGVFLELLKPFLF